MKQFLRLPTVLEKTGLSRTLTYELIQREQFPKAIKLTERSVAWCSEEVDLWMERKIKNSKKLEIKNKGEGYAQD